MDPKRQKIYIGIIAICFLGTAGVLYYGFFQPTESTPPATNQPIANLPIPVNTASGTATKGYTSPSVFPNDNKFDWTVLDSPSFKDLQKMPALIPDAKVGRDNPFNQ